MKAVNLLNVFLFSTLISAASAATCAGNTYSTDGTDTGGAICTACPTGTGITGAQAGSISTTAADHTNLLDCVDLLPSYYLGSVPAKGDAVTLRVNTCASAKICPGVAALFVSGNNAVLAGSVGAETIGTTGGSALTGLGATTIATGGAGTCGTNMQANLLQT